MRFTICAYDGENYFGGPLEWYKRIALAWNKIGIKTEFLFITDHHPKKCNTYNLLKKQGFRCEALRRHSLIQLKDNTEYRVKWILKNLKKRPPDIFISNLSVPACYAGRWVQEAGIPVIPVIHSDDAFFNGIAKKFIFDKDSIFNIQNVVTVSEYLKNKVLNINKLINVKCISCGAPIPNNVCIWNDSKFRVVYVGRMADKQKRICDVAEAFCNIVSKYKNVECVFIGDGPETNKVKDIILKREKIDNIKVIGKIDSSIMQKELLEFQAIVLLSDYEGLPIALLEGMSCGLVPVCLNVPSGIPELVKSGKTGFLVNNRNDDFVNAIGMLVKNKKMWNEISKNARVLVENKYSMRVVAKQWKDYAEFLLKKKMSKKKIKIPRRIELPVIEPSILGDDRRWPGYYEYMAMQLKRIKRRISI